MKTTAKLRASEAAADTDKNIERTASLTDRWSPLNAETLSARIVNTVRGSLFEGELRSGDFLGTERTLAEQFGVSRVAIRDALRSLAAMGIVEVRTGKRGGVRVAEANPEFFANALAIQLKLIGVSKLELLDSQIAIETHAAVLAADRITDEELDAMRQLVDGLDRHVDDPANFFEYSSGFHFAVVKASQNRALITQFEAIRRILKGHYRVYTNSELARKVIQEDKKLIEVLAGRNREDVRLAVASRLARIRSRWASLDSDQ